ncbi:hypothetical protein [Micromonospora sp. NPDC050200]|uniref:hypothetical protein n=1 Tax=Micromonospora sp. NPDC050200 TaxID=3155664 RepID=UPI0033DF804E
MGLTDRGPMAGRTVLITGATRGIGKATALGLARLRRVSKGVVAGEGHGVAVIDN